MNFSTLRNIQGLHAPLKLQMEYRAARQVTHRQPISYITQIYSLCNVHCVLHSSSSLTHDDCPFLFQIQRLPFLQSSNLALDTLKGSDESIGFEDILNGERLFSFYLIDLSVENMMPNHHTVFVSCYLADPAQSEMMGEPHMMVEYKMGLL